MGRYLLGLKVRFVAKKWDPSYVQYHRWDNGLKLDTMLTPSGDAPLCITGDSLHITEYGRWFKYSKILQFPWPFQRMPFKLSQIKKRRKRVSFEKYRHFLLLLKILHPICQIGKLSLLDHKGWIRQGWYLSHFWWCPSLARVSFYWLRMRWCPFVGARARSSILYPTVPSRRRTATICRASNCAWEQPYRHLSPAMLQTTHTPPTMSPTIYIHIDLLNLPIR